MSSPRGDQPNDELSEFHMQAMTLLGGFGCKHSVGGFG
jgi:hypothetical protein